MKSSALQRAEIAEMVAASGSISCVSRFSALQRAEIAEMSYKMNVLISYPQVSVLFNEPKLLKFALARRAVATLRGFSALQRAEIAEIRYEFRSDSYSQNCFSALQRAEIAEILKPYP